MLAGPSRWGQAPGRSTAHGHCLAGPVDPVRIPPLALDPYLVEQRYHRQHLRIFGVSIFVILDACLRPPDQCWGVLAGLCGDAPRRSLAWERRRSIDPPSTHEHEAPVHARDLVDGATDERGRADRRRRATR